MTTTDETDATRALAHRLTEWGVDGAPEKAASFIEALVSRGWAMDAKTKPGRRPPRAEDECRLHPGEWRVNCRCCHADRKAMRDEHDADAAEQRRRTRQEVIDRTRATIRAHRNPEEDS